MPSSDYAALIDSDAYTLPGKAVKVKVGIFIVYIGNFRESDMVRYYKLELE